MAVHEIDIAGLANRLNAIAPDSDLLLGRKVGEEFRKALPPPKIEETDTIVLKLPAGITVTPSVFIGYFGRDLDAFDDAHQVLDATKLIDETPLTKTNYFSAVETLLSEKPAPARSFLRRIIG